VASCIPGSVEWTECADIERLYYNGCGVGEYKKNDVALFGPEDKVE